MPAVTEFSRASGTPDQLSASLKSRLLVPGGPTTSDHFQVGVEPVFLQAHGLVDGDEIEIQMVSGPLNARQYTKFAPAGGRDIVLSTRLTMLPIMYPGTYRLRRIVGAAGATVYGYAATGSHDWSEFYANVGDPAIPPYADTAGFADTAESVVFRDNMGGITAAATALPGGILQVAPQPLDDQGGSAHLSAPIQVAGSTSMQSLILMAIDLLADRKYRFKFTGYFTCASAGGLKVDMLCSNASYMVYSVAIQHPSGTVVDCNLSSGTAVGGTGFTEALVTITGFVQMSADGPIIPRFSQQVSNGTPTEALVGCDINVTERSRY